MHKFPLDPIKSIEKLSKEEQAEHSAYIHPKTGNLYIPALNLQRAFVAGATFSKGKGRATLQKPFAACVSISPEYLDLDTKKYEIDARPVVVPATQGRIVRYRPRLDKWGISFEIQYDPMLVTETELRQVVDDTGVRVGVLDFRPERKGPYGRFVVTSWE